ncbi:hypothetical protein QYF36_014601 [Acer negundo]|nr:hypothetical protein QYF36_014601 [Acer negundo]
MGVNGRKYHAENRKIYRLEPKSARLNSQFEVAEASEDGVARWNQRMKLEASVFNGGKVTRVTDVSVNARGFIAAFVAVWSTSMQHMYISFNASIHSVLSIYWDILLLPRLEHYCC